MIGSKIEELLEINNAIWHEATTIKDFENNPIPGVSSQTRVQTFFNIRKLNAKRSAVRHEVDVMAGDDSASDERKVNYAGE